MRFLKYLQKKLKNEEKEISEEYNAFINADLSKYKKGEYILFSEEGVYDHGFDLEEMTEKFKKENPKKSPAVFKIPPKNFSLM
ncbi:hypothetical protein COV24_03285 [candidate division WWE3 bacterium CG10_big_fil_rev_8_21_14_0_10_32_10]|uniref:DUF5678 domain-containing protein n=1 Tax=candidate division WWE3 bacterium CG10_big_fil_rev_8_21_14_0_10_32_10 TaxID=1975090 RepID=A0A2H0R9V9_UNCKA|nr:MAG: hypothetical protein COV24_03285 [candidate division WWE3 bacterium CG10_big_fil_rev_8_21_14_0_10_32_10]